ncbi:hypothetical protein [Persephonella sp.]
MSAGLSAIGAPGFVIAISAALLATLISNLANSGLVYLWNLSENMDVGKLLDKLLNGSLLYDLLKNYELSNEFMDNLFKNFTELSDQALLRRAIYGDPLVVDLDGDGIETIGLNSSNAMFDLDGDGFREKTGWVSKKRVANQTELLLN